jgi:hypothetical protein
MLFLAVVFATRVHPPPNAKPSLTMTFCAASILIASEHGLHPSLHVEDDPFASTAPSSSQLEAGSCRSFGHRRRKG